MAARDPKRDYEIVLKILSSMELSRPLALVTISQNTGIKLVDVIHCMEPLEGAGIVERTMDNGLIFYVLKTKDYAGSLERLFAPPEQPEPKQAPQMSSREAILKRRSMRQANSSSPQADAQEPSRQTQLHTQKLVAINTVDLLAMKRSSTSNLRVYDTGLSATRMAKLSAAQAAENDLSRSSTMLQSITGSDPLKSLSQSSSSLNKAVYMGRSFSRSSSGSRSTFTATPPAGFDSMALERSDTNFPRRNCHIPKPQGALIPFKSTSPSSHEIQESEVRRKLGLSEDAPFIAILSPRPTQELWSSCSALANAGGGTIILGMRKYIQDGNVTFYIKNVNNPEDAVKLLIRGFNDRTLISDCPRDPNFIEIVEFGRKKVLVIRLDPSQLADAPLYTGYNSYNMRTTQGCYYYRDGEVVHCTNEEIKELWQLRRLGDETADWDQTGEQLPVRMERKKKISLPPVIDDAVRPLSRKVSTYGMPVEQERRVYRSRHFIGPVAAEPVMAGPSDDTDHARAFHFPTEEEEKNNAARLDEFSSENAVAMLVREEESVRPVRRQPSQTDAPQEDLTIKSLLIAEDIRVARGQRQIELPLGAPEAVQDVALPPVMGDADAGKLAEIARAAVDHPRLPATRLGEIAIELCKHARLTHADLSELLHRKYNAIRDKVLPRLKEHPNIRTLNGAYYYQD